MLTKYQQFFTGRPTIKIAQDLLGKMVKYHGPAGTVGGYIVEVEAYLGEGDSASHAFNGRRTGYSESLYGQPGNIYLYQIRGHYCFDIVVQDEEEPQGILLRGMEPAINVAEMTKNRQMTGVNISNGPGKLVQALGIHSRKLDGQPMETSALTVDLENYRVPQEVVTTARIGVNLQGENGLSPNRFFVKGNPYVSNMRKRDMDLDHHGWKD
ncbi:DNA-3-methyladenine glycosylase [Limosilactobacillus caccae]|uniref:DNA-3-methyladenine glycosylase n=1 Tax=Limosilactobacillus caccae TaxID=1926284 RepID=UPI0009704EE9|nr:DNA-3-methyladenine glycosylase [Limosilactobacillus caccae]